MIGSSAGCAYLHLPPFPTNLARQNGGSLQEEIAQFTESVSNAFKSAGYAVEMVDNAVDAKNYETLAARLWQVTRDSQTKSKK